MPFGAIFAALYLISLGIWVGLGDGLGALAPAAARPPIVLLCFALASGLLLARGWARWTVAAWAVLLVATVLARGDLEAGTAAYPLLLASVAAAALLVIPTTGRFRTAGTPSAPRLGRAVAGAAALGAIGVLAGLGWGADRSPEVEEPVPSARQAVGVPENVDWEGFGEGLRRARAEGKPLLVTFVTDWCGYCRKMDRTTWKHPSVVERLRDFVAVRVNAEDGRTRDGYSGSALAAQYGVQGFPTMMLLDGDAQVRAQTGGYQTPRQLLGWLDKALSRAGVPSAGTLRTSGR